MSAFGVVRKPELRWDREKGLTNVSVSTHGGLDLDDSGWWPSFQPHNLGTLHGVVAEKVARKYILELIKSRESG